MASLVSIAPFFVVVDAKASAAFYERALGFTVTMLGPADDPFFAIVERDGVMLMLKAISPEVRPQPNPSRHEWAAMDAYVLVDDPDGLANEFAGRSVAFETPLGDTEDGLRGFTVKDVDGYVLFFGRPV